MLRASILSALIGAGFMAGASAADAAPVVRGPSYEENVSVTCTAEAKCTAKFAAMTQSISFTRASCSVLADAPKVTRAVLGQLIEGVVQRPQFLVPSFVVAAAGKSQYIVSTGVNLQLDTGEIPAIRVFASAPTSQTLACQIVGETLLK